MFHPTLPRSHPPGRRSRLKAGPLAIALSLGVALLGSTPAAAEPGPNVLGNGSFESGSLAPWYAWQDASVVAGNARSGSYALEITSTPGSAEQLVAVEPNTTYRLSGWLRSEASGEPVVLGIKDNYGGGGKTQTVTSTTYTGAAVDFTTGPTNDEVTVFCVKDVGSAKGYCDDLQLNVLEGHQAVSPARDAQSVIKNPAMGWQLYVEGEIPNPTTFWSQVDPYLAPASELYIRLPWSEFEPTEGAYAWQNDADYIALIDGAQQRGLKLAFRIYPDSQDVAYQATPQYVFDAGAQQAGTSNTGFPNPDVMDPVYQQKFENFLTAFGAEYNDPSKVDFVDATGLGWWGEGHHMHLDQADLAPTLEWITDLYRQKLDQVLIALSFGSEFGVDNEDQVRAAKGLAIRRDSLGSELYFPAEAQDAIKARFPASPVFGENCYQNFVQWDGSCDGAIGNEGVTAVLTRVIEHAKNVRSNTLDLRWPATDVPTWVEDHPDLVQDFALNGGYRLAPDHVAFPGTVASGASASITQTWTNSAVGVLPNKLPGWNHKYRVSYALLETDGTVVDQYVDPAIDPGDWLKGGLYSSTSEAMFEAPPGQYQLGVAIVDTTSGDQPAIKLALTDPATASGWHPLGEVTVTQADQAGSITGVGSGRCVDVPNSNYANGTQIVLWDCNGGVNQQWKLTADGRVTSDGICLTVAGSPQPSGAHAVVWECNGTAAQVWSYESGSQTLVNPSTGMCLDAEEGGTANGTKLILWPCHGAANQQWTLSG